LEEEQNLKRVIKRKDLAGAALFFFGIATVHETVWKRDSVEGSVVAVVLIILGLRVMFARSEAEASRASGRILDRFMKTDSLPKWHHGDGTPEFWQNIRRMRHCRSATCYDVIYSGYGCWNCAHRELEGLSRWDAP